MCDNLKLLNIVHATSLKVVYVTYLLQLRSVKLWQRYSHWLEDEMLFGRYSEGTHYFGGGQGGCKSAAKQVQHPNRDESLK